MRRLMAAGGMMLALSLVGCAAAPPMSPSPARAEALEAVAQTHVAIRAVLAAQQDAWNQGDIDGFMEGYWRSPELAFVSGSTITLGWEETRDRYRARYATRALMGQLDFDILDVSTGAGADGVFGVVLGRWRLTRPEAGDAGGYFTLLMRRIDGRWVIVRDHTS